MNVNRLADGAYIAKLHERIKSGKTVSFARRFSRSQYNQGGFNNVISDAYLCEKGYESDIRRFEKIYKRLYHDFLIRNKKNYKRTTEWIDPAHSHINCDHVRNTMETAIRKEKLRIRKIKKEYLERLVDDSQFINLIRNDITKYTDPV